VSDQIKLHVYSIREVLRLKREIENDIQALSLLGAPMETEDFEALAKSIHSILPPRIARRTVHDSLVHLAGDVVTKDLLAELGWRLAGNIPRLRMGIPVQSWHRQARDEWVPMQIVDQVPLKNKKGDTGAIMYFRVLAGTSCTMILDRFWTYRLSKYLASKLGFSAAWGKYPFKKITELTGMRMYGLIEAQKSLGRPYFDQINVPKSVEAYNRKMLRHRQRVGFKCPKKYEHPCYVCPIGYDRCRCAVHPRTYVRAVCSVCDKKAWMDPIHLELRLCVDCFVKRQLARKD
jgi:hypothetical protein